MRFASGRNQNLSLGESGVMIMMSVDTEDSWLFHVFVLSMERKTDLLTIRGDPQAVVIRNVTEVG